MAEGGIFLIIIGWFALYFYINFVMVNEQTRSGDDVLADLVKRKYRK